jgi:hypothetical protein
MAWYDEQPATGCGFCDAVHGLINGTVKWFAQPFRTSGSALTWVLFVGLLIVAVWFWQSTLLAIREDV